MRRLRCDVGEQREIIGDVTTLADSMVVDLISAGPAMSPHD
jgi:hypothetical protein